MFTVLFTKKADKDYEKLESKDKKRIAGAIDALRVQPFSGKKLEGERDGYWSARVWPYRIIYTIDKKIVTVTVVMIGDRKDIYRRLRK